MSTIMKLRMRFEDIFVLEDKTMLRYYDRKGVFYFVGIHPGILIVFYGNNSILDS